LAGAAANIGGLKRCTWLGEAVELTLDNTLDAIQACLPELERFIADHGVRPVVANRIEVIFEELVANAIRHGFTPGSAQSVQVRLSAVSDHVELTFEDDGRPFNPLDQPPPQKFKDLETATIGGLGIPLIRKMSTSVRYEVPAQAADADFRPTNRVVVTVAR
jgi:serine/threonine-protein kinase RsbW